MSRRLEGVFAPVTTPFQGDDVDVRAFGRNVQGYMTTSLAGVVVLGSNGEAPFVEDEEADRLIAAARDVVPASRWLIAGTARESTRATVAATRRAAAAGADAVMVRTPSFYKNRMTVDAFVRHYEVVADQSPVPVILYNITVFTGINLPVAAVATLARHPNIIGIKDSGGDVALLAEFRAAGGDGFSVLCGSAPAFYASMCAGADGAVLGIADIVPDLCTSIVTLLGKGRHDEARALQARLVPISVIIGPRFGIPGVKVAVEATGYVGGPPRLPLLPVPPDAEAGIRAEVASLLELQPA